MRGSYWKTGAPKTRTAKVINPTKNEVIRQLGILIVGGALLIGFAVVSIGSFSSTTAAEPIAQVPAVAASPTSAPTSTAVPPTATAAATSTATSVATAPVVANTPTIAVAASPTTAPTNTPTVAATATTAPVVAAPTATTAPVTGGAVSFSRDVQPIFNQICVKCHGGDDTKEGLSLKSYATVMQGSDNGPVIAPGDAANSLLIQQVLNGKMPKKGPKLLPAQIRTLSDWVAAGAPNN